MSFIEFKSKDMEIGETFKKTLFMKLTGKNIVRVLDGKNLPTFHTAFVHWIRNLPLECLEDECHVCKNNKRIIAENPENFRKVPSYSRKQEIFYVNVLDRTPVKTCPECGAENESVNGRYLSQCKCGVLITEVPVMPCNKVKILTRSKALGNELNAIDNRILDANGDRIGITNFDIQILLGQNNRAFAAEMEYSNDVVDIPEEELFDLRKTPIQLSPDEMYDYLKGTALKDIFASRGSEESSVTEVLEESTVTEIKDKLSGLLF